MTLTVPMSIARLVFILSQVGQHVIHARKEKWEGGGVRWSHVDIDIRSRDLYFNFFPYNSYYFLYPIFPFFIKIFYPKRQLYFRTDNQVHFDLAKRLQCQVNGIYLHKKWENKVKCVPRPVPI